MKGVSFGVKKGERLVILASANSGRSTLLKILVGELQRTSGYAWIDDLNVDRYYKWTHMVGGKIGYCSQENNFDVRATVREQLRLFASLGKIRWDKLREQVDRFLELFVLEEY